MTVREAISYTDALHDNEISEEIKCRWISECEARLWSGVMLLHAQEFVPLSWPADADAVLSAPPPYDELYTAYLSAKLYLAYHEAQNYQNAMQAYNTLYGQYSIWYAAAYDPAHGGRMELRQYPTVVQGETASIAFCLPYPAEEISALALKLRAGDTVLSYSFSDCTWDGDTAMLTLAHEQSLALPAGIAAFTVTGVTKGGDRFEAWPPLTLRVVDTGYREVLS